MNINDVLRLIDAGYTKEEIDTMLAPAAEPEPEPEIAPVPAPAPERVPEPEMLQPETEKRLEKIENILAQIAANGIAASSAPEPEPKRNVIKEILDHL